MSLALLLANVCHGLVALIWVAGLRRVARPVAPALHSDLLALALLLPVVVGGARLLGVPGLDPQWALVRADLWADAIFRAGPAARWVCGTFLGGTALLFVAQELVPTWRARRSRWILPRQPDERLEASLARVRHAFADRRIRRPRGREAQIRRLDTDTPTAALLGLVAPTVVVSRGLLDRLDDTSLDAVVAHELAHLWRGGNSRELLVWALRALQAPSPAALVLFRGYVEAQEVACDALAAEVTGRPTTLAATLLELEREKQATAPAGTGGTGRARQEISRRAGTTATRVRVRALLDADGFGRPPTVLVWAAAAVLGGLLWAIG